MPTKAEYAARVEELEKKLEEGDTLIAAQAEEIDSLKKAAPSEAKTVAQQQDERRRAELRARYPHTLGNGELIEEGGLVAELRLPAGMEPTEAISLAKSGVAGLKC